jgi:pyrimidine deaminase RibD-like protein
LIGQVTPPMPCNSGKLLQSCLRPATPYKCAVARPWREAVLNHHTVLLRKMASHPDIAPNDHKAYMLYALDQARLSPPSPSKFCVGAALVDADKNQILSTGYSEELPRDRPGDPGSTHAEQCCFIKVGDSHGISDFDIAKVLPTNTVLYTTMEPCNERLSGNTTCVERILGLGDSIKVVYVGIREPDTFIKDNEGIKRLEAAGVRVVLLDDDEDLRGKILEVTFAGHESGK